MILHLHGEMNYEMMDILVKSFNNLKEGDKLHIYFTSDGGLTDVTEAMIDFVNKNKDFIGITFYGDVFSSGMVLFLKVECDTGILNDTRGMYHYCYQKMDINETGKPSGDYDTFIYQQMKVYKTKTLEYLKTTPLTDAEIRQVKTGKEVYFTYKRMLEILNG